MLNKQIRTIVAIATYNGEKYIREQLDSLINQTCKPNEIYVRDDGSKDKTIKIIKEYNEKHKNIFVIRENKLNIGYAANFNEIVKEIITNKKYDDEDVVFFCDQDDVWLENKIEIVVQHFNDANLACITHDVEFVDEKLTRTFKTKIEYLKQLNIAQENYIMGAASALKIGFLRDMGSVAFECVNHDDWYVGGASRLKTRKIINNTLSLYRRHSENNSNTIFNNNKINKNIIKKINDGLLKIKNRKQRIKLKLKYEQEFLKKINKPDLIIKKTSIKNLTTCIKESKNIIIRLEERENINNAGIIKGIKLAIIKYRQDKNYRFKEMIVDILF
jgi:rhamnosyltransferase